MLMEQSHQLNILFNLNEKKNKQSNVHVHTITWYTVTHMIVRYFFPLVRMILEPANKTIFNILSLLFSSHSLEPSSFCGKT